MRQFDDIGYGKLGPDVAFTYKARCYGCGRCHNVESPHRSVAMKYLRCDGWRLRRYYPLGLSSWVRYVWRCPECSASVERQESPAIASTTQATVPVKDSPSTISSPDVQEDSTK
jgi:hypothetical protein